MLYMHRCNSLDADMVTWLQANQGEHQTATLKVRLQLAVATTLLLMGLVLLNRRQARWARN